VSAGGNFTMVGRRWTKVQTGIDCLAIVGGDEEMHIRRLVDSVTADYEEGVCRCAEKHEDGGSADTADGAGDVCRAWVWMGSVLVDVGTESTRSQHIRSRVLPITQPWMQTR
jgi:hypothetical protein